MASSCTGSLQTLSPSARCLLHLPPPARKFAYVFVSQSRYLSDCPPPLLLCCCIRVQVLLLKIPGLKAVLGIPDMAKIQAEQAAASGQRSTTTPAVKAPVIPTAVFASRAEAVRAREATASASTDSTGSTGSASAAAQQPAGMTKGNRVKRAGASDSRRKMHAAFSSEPHVASMMVAPVTRSGAYRGFRSVASHSGSISHMC